ncbi:MAG: peptidoglycan DD-metalloendopeptidase family protein [Caldilineaceae bacterium]
MISCATIEAGSVGLGGGYCRGDGCGDATVALGRYGEARLAYTALSSRPRAGGTARSRRTVHLGLDLFAVAGTPVHAAGRGCVASAQVNDAPLDYGPTVILRHVTGDGVPFYTLYGHLSSAAVTAPRRGRRSPRATSSARLGDTRENGGWPPHLHLQLITDLVDDSGNFPAWPGPVNGRSGLRSAPIPPLLGLDHVADPFAMRPSEEILAVRRAHLGRTRASPTESR